VHARNYADLPIFDMLFGTFHNPRGFAPATGADMVAAFTMNYVCERDLQCVADVANPFEAFDSESCNLARATSRLRQATS